MKIKNIEIKKIDKLQFEEPACILKALSNRIRLSVIYLLSDGKEMTVSELMQIIDCEQSLLSYHLTDMYKKDILNSRKRGKNTLYSIKNDKVVKMLSCIISKK